MRTGRLLRSRPIVALLTVLGVASGVALYGSIQILNRAAIDYFEKSVAALSGKGALSVHAGPGGFREEVLERAAAVPGVAAAVPMVETTVWHMSPGGNREVLHILGVDFLQEGAANHYGGREGPSLFDPLDFVADPTSVMLSDRFAQSRGLRVGSKLQLRASRGEIELTVKRILASPGLASAYGGMVALMDIDAARLQFGKVGRIDRIDIVPQVGEDLGELSDHLRSSLGPAFEVERPAARTRQKARLIQSFQVMMKFLSLSGLVIGAFLVSNSMSILVTERRRQIGILRALGATQGTIARMFLFESGILGGLGACLGAVGGWALAGGMERRVLNAMSPLEPIQYVSLPVDPADLMLAAAIGFGGACVGALWPAMRASRLMPIEAMRGNKLEESSQPIDSAHDRLWPAGLLALAVALGGSYAFRHVNLAPIVFAIQAVTILGGALLAPRAVALALAYGGRGLQGQLLLARSNLLRNPKRFSMNVMSMCVGLMLVVVIASVASSFRGTLMNWYDGMSIPDLLVTWEGRAANPDAEPFEERLVERLKGVPGVAGVSGVRATRIAYAGSSPILKAVDEGGLQGLEVLGPNSEERIRQFFHAPKPTVFASELFMKRFGKSVGDTIALSTGKGQAQFRIIGEVVDYASLQGVLYLARAVYREQFGDSLLTAVAIRLLPAADASIVRAQINQALGPNSGLTAVSNLEIKSEMAKRIDDTFRYTDAIEWIALLIAALGLMNSTYIGIVERKRELGILRAVGMTSLQLTGMLIRETVALSLLVACFAIALGIAFGGMWIKNNLTAVLGWPVEFHLPGLGILRALLLAGGIGFLAGWIPARITSRAKAVDALTYE